MHLPHTISEVTGPVFGNDLIDVKAFDLTKQHSAEPIGERIVVSGRVIDEDGRPLPHTLVEVWQANSAGRYAHAIDQHDAPLDPNFTGCGHTVTDGVTNRTTARSEVARAARRGAGAGFRSRCGGPPGT